MDTTTPNSNQELNDMNIYQKIRFLREAQSISQEKMAEKLGMSRNGYAKIESGETDIKFSKLQEIATLLNMNLLELFSLGEKNIMLFNPYYQHVYVHHNQREVTFCNNKSSSEQELELKNQEIMYLKRIVDLLEVQLKELKP